MKRLSPLSWCLCEIEHCHAEGADYQLRGFNTFSLSSFQRSERGFKRQTLCQWWGSENCSDKVTQRTVNRILQGRETYSYSKVGQCYWEKCWLDWEKGMWSTENKFQFWCMIVVSWRKRYTEKYRVKSFYWLNITLQSMYNIHSFSWWEFYAIHWYSTTTDHFAWDAFYTSGLPDVRWHEPHHNIDTCSCVSNYSCTKVNLFRKFVTLVSLE